MNKKKFEEKEGQEGKQKKKKNGNKSTGCPCCG